jgi:oligopeptide/dipeptide ABC transporter ATP-binding protein
MDEPLLRVENVKKHFPVSRGTFLGSDTRVVKAVDDVSFTLQAGEVLGVVGESGSGKSTLGRLVLGLIEPTSGEVWFEGERTKGLSGRRMRALRLKMQIVFQDPFGSLNPRMPVGKSIGYALHVNGIMTGEALRIKVGDLLEQVGLSRSHADRLPHQLSGGQRQRVGIARAVSVNPRLIVADEPIAALDLSAQAQVLNLFKDLQQQLGIAYIFVTHDLSVAAFMSNRIAVMYGGQIVEMAERRQLLDDPQHPYTQALLSAAVLGNWQDQVEEIVLEGDPPSPINPPPGCKFHPRCPLAGSYCQAAEPELKEIEAGHVTACHVAHGVPVEAMAASGAAAGNS